MRPLVRAYFKSYPWLEKLPFHTGLISGLALGLFDRRDFHDLDELNAGRTDKWASEQHNLRGLLGWERQAIESWFPSEGRLMITAVGGGREVLALEPMGYELETFECNPHLVDAANRHLQRHDLETRVQMCPRDAAPRVDGAFDGAIVGWGSYTLIMGKQTRIDFLKALATNMKPNSPILVSYFKEAESTSLGDKLQHGLATWLRRVRSAPELERSDVMDWNYRHRFDDRQVTEELTAAGFRVVHISDEGYPHAVGIQENCDG